ncbi:GNAT family N-acetyltransferase [Glycomyces terrestris]|uniref:N-acetyltransferase n=1 Tax=Glycomyces terrestris TaxID=2493553 RepID=A0A426UVD7_9ACTN|nr:GNAT family N-acetyltransferase [Glycomyces terrestris]RRR98280.1 N-acetyltransferase [Glycomyces terrestris]
MTLTTWYFEMRDPGGLAPAKAPAEEVAVVRAELPSPEFSRFLYAAVGGRWNWTDRLPWSEERWRGHLERPGVETWVGYVRGTPAGFAELDGTVPGEVELAYFGLLPDFIGRGLGGHLLTEAVRRAWTLADRWPGLDEPRRVWGHTCTDDSPVALGNYERRGFRVYRTEET